MHRSIVDMGMKKVNLCFDKQLYDGMIQVCWNQPRKSIQLVIVIFACIGTLMECSAWDFYVIVVYGGVRGIYNGKSWMKAMRLFLSVLAALLK